ncbi:hypothetical protein [Sphingomicrobium astaxanthinifaciens]|nr:hypothetical protein [Sphingomicrobium astaxanthinifaciens]
MPPFARLRDAIARLLAPMPETIDIEGLGELRRDPDRPNCYTASVAFDGAAVTLVIHDEAISRRGIAAAAPFALEMLEMPDVVQEEAREIAGEQLFSRWLFGSEGDETVSLYDWKRGLALDRIWVMPDGRTMVDFAPGRPFAGHRVTVAGRAPLDFDEAYLSV